MIQEKPRKKFDLVGLFITLTLVSLPLYLVRCANFSFCDSPVPFTLLEVLILITFGYWFYLQIKTNSLKQKLSDFQNKIPTIIQLFILIFLLAGLIASFVSPDIRAGLGIYKAYFLEGFLLFVVVFDYLLTIKNYKLIVWSLVGSAFWIALLAVLNQVFQYNPGNIAEFSDRGRTSAIYSTSNAVGLFVGPVTIILFGYIFSLRKTKKTFLNEKNIAIIALIILFFGLLSSGSRGGLLGVFAGIIFYIGYLLYLKLPINLIIFGKKVFLGFLIAVSLLIFLFFINIKYFAQNPPKITNNFQSSFNSRLCLWDGAVEIIKARPLTGAGLSGFQEVHDQYRTCSLEQSIYPHNIFLNFWTEIGFFGLISFVSLSSYLFFKLLGFKKTNYLKVALACVLITILVHGLVDVPFFKNDLSVQFWTILALSLFLLPEN